MGKITGKVNYKEVLKGDIGYTFEPHVTVDGVLYWTNNGNLENPLPVNLHGKQGFMFIPHVDDEGNLSWTNTGELENPPTVNIKGDKGYFYTPHISEDGILSWSNNGNLENPQPFNISDLILNEVKESRVDTTGKTFTKLKERLDSDFKKLSESIKNNDTKDEVVQARTATTGENFMTLDDRIDHEVMRLREKIEVTMLEQEDKESHDISNTIDGVCSDMIIKGKTIKLDNDEIKSFGQQENKISILSHSKNLCDVRKAYTDYTGFSFVTDSNKLSINGTTDNKWAYVGIPVKLRPNIDLTFSFKGSGNNNFLKANIILESNKNNSLTGDISANSSTTFRVNERCTVIIKLFFSGATTGNFNVDYWDIQLEEGTQSTPYEPYKEDKKDILLSSLGFDEGLRGLNLTVCDELNGIKNVAIKRVEKHSFTGNENISLHDTQTETISFRYLNDTHITSWEKPSNLLCTSLPSIGNKIYESNNVGCASDNIGFIFRLNKNSLTSQDVEGFRKWLKANPTTIYYELAEPIETPLTDTINAKAFNDRTYINFENSIKGTSSFKVPVNTNKLINDLKFEKEDLKEKFNNLTNEFENFKTYMIQTLPYKEV
ncbi:hypothetical protein [Clostridium phage vB_CpeP_PM11]|uniref:Uncharacterized protein n=1 Tax=Clostridium phage vB_CpeP_PM11 TaxID=2970322 RepID=A0A976SPN9_9CAUD|nr:hypothetical protein [Clostridium phage vB_CpeP_PM11]